MRPAAGAPDGVPRTLRRLSDIGWRVLVLAAVAALAVIVLSKLVLVWLPVLVALLGATALHPLVCRLRGWGWPRLLAVWAVLLGALIVVGGIVFALVQQTIAELDDLDVNLRQGADDVTRWLSTGPLGLSGERVDDLIQQGRDYLESGGGIIAGGVWGGTMVALEVVFGLFVAIVVLFFVLKDGDRMWAWLAGGLGERLRPRVDEAGRRSWAVLGSYVRGMLVVGVFEALAIAIVLLALGVPLVLPIAVLTAVAPFFPLIGATVAGVVAALVALGTEGLVDALIVTAAVIVVQQVEGDVLQPVVLGRAVRLHPVVILLALTAGITLAGLLGALLAFPVAAIAVALGRYMKEVSAERAAGGA